MQKEYFKKKKGLALFSAKLPLEKEMATHSSVLAVATHFTQSHGQRGTWQATVHGVARSRT